VTFLQNTFVVVWGDGRRKGLSLTGVPHPVDFPQHNGLATVGVEESTQESFALTAHLVVCYSLILG